MISLRLEVVDECESTNELLLSRRNDPAFDGSALLALKQTSGRGRRGNSWWTGEGNLALSVGLRVTRPQRIPLYSFAAGLALVDVLAPLLPPAADLRLKWPNDLYLNGKKLSGLLAQVRQSGDVADLVLGIGLNLLSAPPGEEALALAEVTGSVPPAEDFARLILQALPARIDQPSAELIRDWNCEARILGAELRVVGEPGDWTGLGLEPSGELLVRGSDGTTRKLASETVSLRFR